jgi:hypothetical protein
VLLARRLRAQPNSRSDLKLTRTSSGWHPDDGVTCSDRACSPATISSLWERGLLDANFTDLRVIYGAPGLIDMKNLDGACYADLPELPKFQRARDHLGGEDLQGSLRIIERGEL